MFVFCRAFFFVDKRPAHITNRTYVRKKTQLPLIGVGYWVRLKSGWDGGASPCPAQNLRREWNTREQWHSGGVGRRAAGDQKARCTSHAPIPPPARCQDKEINLRAGQFDMLRRPKKNLKPRSLSYASISFMLAGRKKLRAHPSAGWGPTAVGSKFSSWASQNILERFFAISQWIICHICSRDEKCKTQRVLTYWNTITSDTLLEYSENRDSRNRSWKSRRKIKQNQTVSPKPCKNPIFLRWFFCCSIFHVLRGGHTIFVCFLTSHLDRRHVWDSQMKLKTGVLHLENDLQERTFQKKIIVD